MREGCELFLGEGRALLQISAGAEARVDLAGDDESARAGLVALMVDVIDVLDQLRKESL